MRKFIVFGVVFFICGLQRWLLTSDWGFRLLALPGLEGGLELMGKWKAWRAFEVAQAYCPAYASFLATHSDADVHVKGWSWVPDFSAVPAMDKVNYVRRYAIEERCLGGALPSEGCIDESSGSTGEPTDWVRGHERKDSARTMRLALRQVMGRGKPIIFLNAFALGPWATGMCVSDVVIDTCLVKSIGPDVDKIVRTLNKFGGTNYRYVVAGYPPFLAALARNANVNWSEYDCTAFYGGEGMSEGMRRFLESKAFRKVYGDYGASDLDINIGAETELTIAVRRLMAERTGLRWQLNGRPGNDAPMIFQYNPMDFLIETSAEGELLITLCRTSNTAPKIRYNIHDRGHVIPFGRVQELLRAEGVTLPELESPLFQLPFLFLYGRSDLAVAYYGCKIAPGQVEQAIYGMDSLAPIVNSFVLMAQEDASHDKQLTIAVELVEGAEPPENVSELRQGVYAGLARISQDFRESVRMVPAGKEPALEFYAPSTGPFEGMDMRLKRNYILSAAGA